MSYHLNRILSAYTEWTTVPQTPRKRSRAQYDHTYSIQESPRSVKRKVERAYEQLSFMMRRLKTFQSNAKRLKKNINSLQEVVNTLKENNYLTKQGLQMWENTCDKPAEICNFQGKAFLSEVFALTLNFHSTKANSLVRKTFNYPTHLSSGNSIAPSVVTRDLQRRHSVH